MYFQSLNHRRIFVQNSTGSACSFGTAGWFCCSPHRTVGMLLPLAPALISSPGMLLDPATNALTLLPLGVAGKVLLPFENVSLVGLLPFDRWSSCSVTGYRSAAICNCVKITGTRYCIIIIFFRFVFVQDIWHMSFLFSWRLQAIGFDGISTSVARHTANVIWRYALMR